MISAERRSIAKYTRSIFWLLASGCFLLMCFCQVACRKRDSVTGTVTNLITGQPVSNIKVNVTGINSGFFSDKVLTQLNSGLTDANGKFSIDIKFKADKKTKYYISIDGPVQAMDTGAVIDEKYSIDENLYPLCNSSVTAMHHPPGNIDFRVAPLSRIKLVGHQLPPFITPVGDGVTVTLSGPGFSFAVNGNVVNQSTPKLIYQGFDEYLQVPSDGKVFITWSKTRNNTQSGPFYDTVFVAPFAKNVYHVYW